MWSTPVFETLPEAISFYLDDCLARGMSPNTITIKRQSLTRFVNWCATNGITKPQDVNLEVMEGFRQYLHHYKKILDGKPLSINSQHKFLTDLKLFLRRLHRRRIIQNADFEEFEMPRYKRRLPKAVLSHEEVERIFFIASLRGDRVAIRDRAILELYYASAIRRSELVRLRLGDIELDKQILTVEGKGEKDRRLPIATRACEWVKAYLDSVRPHFKGVDSGDVLFLSTNGEPMDPDQAGRMVGKYVRRAGIDKPGACHLFRHAAATAMLDAGADIRHVQEMLGHADISTTQIYTFVAIKQLEKVYNRTHPSAQ
ncbi:tyrosine-type recombinase/integrase [Teredinibacter haidensis]|uniref:tyrosine-type recombinase/integrase n=1 Tax=Teredinibacter haidensis TaxID=2731755 RepID=UPI000948B3D5|nr:tyrosine-type recombinase/integrase [Teredinibacter haidensis]